ncbi:hypothetical protein Hanom_Chr16g01518501 [Helianthus anomalus]
MKTLSGGDPQGKGLGLGMGMGREKKEKCVVPDPPPRVVVIEYVMKTVTRKMTSDTTALPIILCVCDESISLILELLTSDQIPQPKGRRIATFSVCVSVNGQPHDAFTHH